MTPTYEQLGAFYLGHPVEAAGEGGAAAAARPATADGPEPPFLYDSKDLVTHAVIVGMTGSGKTGLGISLIEEAAIDGIPAIVIDPKGDLTNLLLTFPELAPEDFLPWLDPGEATREGRTLDEQARHVADTWRAGLARSAQGPERIRRFMDAAERVVYTPGASAGRPLSVLKGFRAPPPAVQADADAFRERITATASSVLALVGEDADPLKSRAHILVASLLEHAWRAGRDLDLAGLIHGIQAPPFQKVGILDLESFFPGGDRFALAMTVNNLVASPAFAAWSDGEPLDIGRLLHAADGRPRVSVLSIAHLGDAERMFFVTTLLNELVGWMRAQPGTQSLRALLYMDEVFGYLPPTANPPSKLPLLTLLKQARAFGLGCVLATQNPVDLDYKALSNAGSWFLGRLQTERDKARVLDGLEGAAAATGHGFDRGHMDRLLAGLGKRVFLLNDVHEDGPVLFRTRWCLSYLRGPLTRDLLKRLTPDGPAPTAGGATSTTPPTAVAAGLAAATDVATERPVLPPEIPQGFVPVDRTTVTVSYTPALLGVATVHYVAKREDVDLFREIVLLQPLGGDDGSDLDPWSDRGEVLDARPRLDTEPSPGASFAALPAAAARARSYARFQKQLGKHLHEAHPLELLRAPDLGLCSDPGETEGAFRVRIREALHERRDLAVEKLRHAHAKDIDRLDERIRVAGQRVERESDQLKARGLETAVSIGATVLGAFFGRKLTSARNVARASSAARGAGRIARERADVERAQETLETLTAERAELERRLEGELARIQADVDESAVTLDRVTVRLRKSDLDLAPVTLAWVPHYS